MYVYFKMYIELSSYHFNLYICIKCEKFKVIKPSIRKCLVEWFTNNYSIHKFSLFQVLNLFLALLLSSFGGDAFASDEEEVEKKPKVTRIRRLVHWIKKVKRKKGRVHSAGDGKLEYNPHGDMVCNYYPVPIIICYLIFHLSNLNAYHVVEVDLCKC